MTNLDFLTAKYGQLIVDERNNVDIAVLENAITAALDILAQQGVYAMFLWLHQDGNQGGETVRQQLDNFLHDTASPVAINANQHVSACINDVNNALDTVREELTSDVRRMYLIRALFERILVYARHRAKAR
jgi:hypothetical protein